MFTFFRHSCLADDKARPKTVVKWNVVLVTLKPLTTFQMSLVIVFVARYQPLDVQILR